MNKKYDEFPYPEGGLNVNQETTITPFTNMTGIVSIFEYCIYINTQTRRKLSVDKLKKHSHLWAKNSKKIWYARYQREEIQREIELEKEEKEMKRKMRELEEKLEENTVLEEKLTEEMEGKH